MISVDSRFSAFYRYLTCNQVDPDEWSEPQPEDQGSDYESAVVRRGSHLWRIRTARVTPTKPGAFVAVWERDPSPGGTTWPFHTNDGTDGLLVFVEDQQRFGVFEFTPDLLSRLKVTPSDDRPGKRGFRVYPEWCGALNKSAERAQALQATAFQRIV